ADRILRSALGPPPSAIGSRKLGVARVYTSLSRQRRAAPAGSGPRQAASGRPPARGDPRSSGQGQPRNEVLEQALAAREAGFGELAHDLRGRGQELDGTWRLHAAGRGFSLALKALDRRRRLPPRRGLGARGWPRTGLPGAASAAAASRCPCRRRPRGFGLASGGGSPRRGA